MWITKKGRFALEKKVRDMEMELREKLAELGRQAERDPDLPENPIWKQLQIDVSINWPKKIREAKEILFKSRIIEDSLDAIPERDIRVNLGSKVTIRYEDGATKTFVVVGPYDTGVIKNGLSYLSPLGNSVMRAEVGEEREVLTPGGKKRIEIMFFEKDGLA